MKPRIGNRRVAPKLTRDGHFGTVSVKWNQMNCPLWLYGKGVLCRSLSCAQPHQPRAGTTFTKVGLLKDPGTIHPSVTLQ